MYNIVYIFYVYITFINIALLCFAVYAIFGFQSIIYVIQGRRKAKQNLYEDRQREREREIIDSSF